MNWYQGEVGPAIQKAMSEKKVFIVFVKDDGEDSTKMEALWDEPEVASVCSDAKCVAINISAGELIVALINFAGRKFHK